MTKISVVAAYAEAANLPSGKPEYSAETIGWKLRETVFGDHKVLGVIHSHPYEQVKVPAFGYDARAEASGDYKPEPWGITRIFGYTLILDGEIDPKTTLGTWELIPRSLYIELCGVETQEKRGYQTAKKISPDFIPVKS